MLKNEIFLKEFIFRKFLNLNLFANMFLDNRDTRSFFVGLKDKEIN